MANTNPKPDTCLLCHSNRTPKHLFTKNNHPIFFCPECQVRYVYPQPNKQNLLSLYTSEYFDRGNKYSESASKNNPNHHNDLVKLDLIKRLQPNGNLLDVGCAKGEFLDTAQQAGYVVKGVEVSADASRYARKNFGLDVETCDISTAHLSDNSFDIATMWDVIEHLDDPDLAISQVSTKLKKHGHLLISTGNISSFWARVTRRHWQLLTPPQHLFYFNESSLSRLLNKHGFSDIKFSYLPKVATLGFILFKAEESFGKIISPLKSLSNWLDADQLKIRINLFDIVTCIAKKT